MISHWLPRPRVSPRFGGLSRSDLVLWPLADLGDFDGDVRFSNRPFEVKHFQTIRHCSVDVAHGLVLLFGIGTKGLSIMGFEDEAEQSFGRPCRQSNGRNQADIRTHLIHRPARDILPPADLRLPPDALILGTL